jgi:DNA replication protein DnaC
MVLTLDDLIAATKSVLKGWRKRSIPPDAFRSLQLFQKQLDQNPTATPQNATLAVLKLALNEFALSDKAGGTLLREHYELQMTVAELALKYACSESKYYTMQRDAIRALAETLATLEHRHALQLPGSPLQHLPPAPYHYLFGINAHLAKLVPLFSDNHAPWLTALVGIGGIGKTSLADALARHLVEQAHFEEIAWVSAQQVIFSLAGDIQSTGRTALTVESLLQTLLTQTAEVSNVRTLSSVDEALRTLIQRFSTKRHLIVIDNFETIADIERLLPCLRQLVNPSKILLTSRVHPLNATDLFAYQLPELECPDALNLLKSEAHLRNFEDLRQNEDLLASIYGVVGGNPLALRLIVGQAFLYGVDTVLRDLTHARHSGEQLYRYIYHYVWTHLEEPTRVLLLAMPLLPEAGGSLDLLLHIAGLPEHEVRTQLTLLVAQNLVTVHGNAQARFYRIHNLTRAFLKEAIIQW